MKYPKLGTYRRTVNQIRLKYKITPLDFDIMLYIAENGMSSKYDLRKNVTNSAASINHSIKYLLSKGLIKNVRPHRTGVRGFPSGYSITGRGRSIITEFYMIMFPDVEIA
jgi:predicted HTH transcriptional regulator